MPSDNTPPTTLATDLRRLGLNRTADDLNDRIADATRKRWSPTVLPRTPRRRRARRPAAQKRRAPSHPRTTRALQAPRRLGLGLADRTRTPRPRTNPLARLPRPRRERHPRRCPGPRQDHARKEHRPPGRPRWPLRSLHHRRRPPPRPQRPGNCPRPRTPSPALHAARTALDRRTRLPRLRRPEPPTSSSSSSAAATSTAPC